MNIVYLDSYALNPGDLAWSALKSIGNVTLYDATKAGEVVARLEDADVAIVNKVLLDKEVLGQLPNLRLVAVTATGVNNVDLKTAKELGITVCNVPAYSTMSVVQMIFAHILQFTNNISFHNTSVQEGAWEQSEQFCFWKSDQIEIAGKTLGIVGFGNIGQSLARVALAFGMKVIVFNRSQKETFFDVTYVDKNTLFSQSDFVALACALSSDTKNIVNEVTLRMMKPTAFLINTGRGPLVDEMALSFALNSGEIAGAGIDVLTEEPPRSGSPLIGAKNCVITPHIAWATKEARGRALSVTADNIVNFIAHNPQNVVN